MRRLPPRHRRRRGLNVPDMPLRAFSPVLMASEQSAQGGGVAVEISSDFAERSDALFEGDRSKEKLVNRAPTACPARLDPFI